MRALVWLTLFVTLAEAAWGAGFAAELRSCNAALRGGSPAEALEGLRALQIERPDSPWVLYALGAAQHQLGRGHAVAQEMDPALEAFAAAARYFGLAAESDLPELRQAALFNRANAAAQAGLTEERANERGAAIERLGEAIGHYEELLREFPSFAPGLHNLDAVRYRRKLLLRASQQQDPPPRGQEERGNGGNAQPSKQQGKDERADQKAGQQESADAPRRDAQPEGSMPQPQSEREGQQRKEEQAAKRDQPPENGEEGEALRAAQMPEVSEQSEQREKELPRASKLPRNGPQRLDRASIAALLESLEDVDREVQRERLSGPRDTRVPREWW